MTTTLPTPAVEKAPSLPARIFDAIHLAFHGEGQRIFKITQTIVWVCITLSIIFLSAEPVLEGEAASRARFADLLLLGFFAVEYLLRVASYRPPALRVFNRPPLGRLPTHVVARVRFMLHPLMLVDLVTVLAVVPALRGLRVLRFLRGLRYIPIFRYNHPILGVAEAFKENRVLFGSALSFLGIVTVMSGVTFFLVEVKLNEDITTIGDGIWWAIVTLTTVGYGDVSPVTPLGRTVAGAVMVTGMFTLAMFAGVVSHSLLNAVLSIRQEQFRMSNYVNHVIVCGYDSGTLMLLDTISAEVGEQDARIVVFAPGPRPEELPQQYFWVQGDPTKESQLDKIRLTHCAAVIVGGVRSLPASQSDAIVILTTFTIRSYLRGHRNTAKRQRPVYIVAEILDAENVSHAKNAGADEVIQTHQLGYSLLAHAITNPGTADTMSNVVFRGAHNLYIGKIPDIDRAKTYRDVMMSLHLRDRGGLAIGYRNPHTGEEILNPSNEELVPAGSHVIYLAKQPLLELP